jgi:hypothetical protein
MELRSVKPELFLSNYGGSGRASPLPVIVKLSRSGGDVGKTAKAAVDAGLHLTTPWTDVKRG